MRLIQRKQPESTNLIHRGKGARRMVGDVPLNWQEFLREDKNKMDLFEFLAMHIASIQPEKKDITNL